MTRTTDWSLLLSLHECNKKKGKSIEAMCSKLLLIIKKFLMYKQIVKLIHFCIALLNFQFFIANYSCVTTYISFEQTVNFYAGENGKCCNFLHIQTFMPNAFATASMLLAKIKNLTKMLKIAVSTKPDSQMHIF